jgi:hypothetical protein
LPVAQKAIRFVKASAPSFLEQMKDEQPSGKIAYRCWQRGGGYDRNVIEPDTVEKMIE